MIQLIKEGNTTKSYIKEYIIDTPAERNQLPTDIPAGSSAFCAENSAVYMLNGSGQWVEI